MSNQDQLLAEIRMIADALHDIADYAEGQKEVKPAPEYRPDGFSFELSPFGARRFSSLDLVLEDLAAGDEFDRDVAEKAQRWLAFDIEKYPGLAPEDAIRKAAVREARNGSWGASVIFSRGSYHAPFKMRLPEEEQDALANKYFEFIDGHAFIFIKGTTPQNYAQAYAESLAQEAVELRRRAREAESGIERPV